MRACLPCAMRCDATHLRCNVVCLRCACHVLAVCLPCACRVLAVCLPCACRVLAVCLRCACRLLAVCLPCACHALAVCLPCACRSYAHRFARRRLATGCAVDLDDHVGDLRDRSSERGSERPGAEGRGDKAGGEAAASPPVDRASSDARPPTSTPRRRPTRWSKSRS